MGSESVGSNLPLLFANPNQQQSIETRNNFQNLLPISQETATVSPSSPTSSNGGGGATITTIPDRQCPCGGGFCFIRTSKTEKNPGRQFYRCPGRPACRFFQWCDENSSDQGVRVAVSPYPMCSCGAGPGNRLKVTKEGKNKGRFFFVCPVTKGQGACNFFQWEDETKHSPQSTLGVQESRVMDDKTVKQGAYGEFGSFSPGSVVRGSELQSTEEYPVKEEEVCRSNSGGVDDEILSPIRNLRLSEENNTSVAKPGQCYRCGKAGHWMKDCVFSSSPCFKCGKTGHWMKDCTA